MTETFVIQKEYIPAIFSKQMRLLPGDKAEARNANEFKVYDKEGNYKGIYDKAVIRKHGKRIVNDLTGKTIFQEVGQRIKRAREKRNMTQEELAAKIGATKQYLSGLENGRNSCGLEQLVRICNVLDHTLRVRITRDYDLATKEPD